MSTTYIEQIGGEMLKRLSNRLNRAGARRRDASTLTCAFIIRFHYKQDDQRFEWRLKYFEGEVLPRIRAQTEKGFDICVRCNPVHYEIFESLGCKPFHVKNEYAGYVLSENRTAKYFYDFVKWEDCVDLARLLKGSRATRMTLNPSLSS